MAKNELDARFAQFGTVSFASVTQVNDFVGYLEEGKLMGTRCKTCGKSFFPPRAHCYQCLAGDMEWFEIAGKGELVSYSTLQYAPAGFTEEVPYTIALVDYGEYKVFGRIDNICFRGRTLGRNEDEGGGQPNPQWTADIRV